MNYYKSIRATYQIGVTVIFCRLAAWQITCSGHLLHTVKNQVNRLPTLVDNPHLKSKEFVQKEIEFTTLKAN